MADKIVVLTTCGSQQEAKTIAGALVELRLAACVNIVPGIESIYRWREKIETATEWLLIIKTTKGKFDSLRAALIELHSYEMPECIEISITDGTNEYLDWIEESVR